MALKTDPGGVFDSDAHRRVLGALPAWRTEDGHAAAAAAKVEGGTIAHPSEHERSAHFSDVAADTIRDPHTEVANHDEVSAVLADLERDGHVAKSDAADGHFEQTEQGFKALTGPVAGEPPPLGGPRLKVALELNDIIAAEDAAKVAATRAERLAWHRAEIERLEAEATEEDA